MRSITLTRFLHFILASVIAGLLSNCGLFEVSRGGGDATETGNARVSGHLVFENGQVAENAEVVILNSDFNPVSDGVIPDSLRVQADSHGAFHFQNLDSGTYTIQAKHAKSHTLLLIAHVHVSAKNSLQLKDTLRISGALSVPIPESEDSGDGYIFVPGTTLKNHFDSEIRTLGKVEMDSIPACLIPSIVYTKGFNGAPLLSLGHDISVPKGMRVQIPPNPNWGHTLKLKLDAGASGVLISKDLYAFPMLVRLASPQFDFSQAQAGGQDLRFTKADGTRLAHEIEVWDPVAGHAEIWVRVDTVYAGSSNQFITMHWGNAAALAPKFPTRVFDNSNGFNGVWHLGEEKADTLTEGLYQDATGKGNNGNDRVTNTDKTGVIAGGHGFDSTDYIQAPIRSGTISKSNAFTLSIWFKPSKVSLLGDELISMGDNYGLRYTPAGRLHGFYYPPVPPVNSTYPWYQVESQDSISLNGTWHLAAVTFDGSSLYLYLDGQEVGFFSAPGPIGYLFPLNVTLGKHGNGKKAFELSGNLDEAESHAVARSKDWLRLSYENQKPGATFPTLMVP